MEHRSANEAASTLESQITEQLSECAEEAEITAEITAERKNAHAVQRKKARKLADRCTGQEAVNAEQAQKKRLKLGAEQEAARVSLNAEQEAARVSINAEQEADRNAEKAQRKRSKLDTECAKEFCGAEGCGLRNGGQFESTNHQAMLQHCRSKKHAVFFRFMCTIISSFF